MTNGRSSTAGDAPAGMPSDRLRRHRTPLLLAIVVVALAIRLVYFVQISSGPAAHQHRWGESDMNFFQSWAGAIAEGDWLTERPLHPHHSWHARTARLYFEAHPGELERLGGSEDTAARALWNEWYGGTRFHQEPLYPYLVAGTRLAFGRDVRWVFAWQMVLGILCILLVHAVARRLFGEVTALVAAVLALCCSPLLFYEMQLLRATPLVFIGLLLVWLTLRALEGGERRDWAFVGIAAGVALLLKTTHAIYIAGLLAFLLVAYRNDRRRLVRSVLPVLAGVLLCLAPAVARNVAVGAPPFSLTSVGAIGIILANAEGASTTGYSFLTQQGATIMGDSGARMLPAAIASLATHDSPLDWLRLLGDRFLHIWHWYEVPNNVNFYFVRLHASILRALPISFLSLAPLALVGLFFARRRIQVAWPLYLMAGNQLLSLVAFGNLSRYRLVLLALSIPLAAFTLTELAAALRRRRYRVAVAALAGTALISVWTARPAPRPLLRAVDYAVAVQVYYLPLQQAALAAEDWPAVEGVFRELLRIEPREVRELGGGQVPSTRFTVSLAGFYSQIYRDYGQALSAAGRTDEAADRQRRSLELARAAGSRRP